MKNLWMLAIANIRKTKSASITLVIMFIIAALLLNTGLLVAINYGSFFETLKTELSASDVYYIFPDALYSDEVQSYINDNEHIVQSQAHDMKWLGAHFNSNGKNIDRTVLFTNMDEERQISKWKFVGEHLPSEGMSVYVPNIFQSVSGYELNDEIELKYTDEETGAEKSLTFTIKGFVEDVFFSATDTGLLSFYLSEDTYEKVDALLNSPMSNINVVFAKLDDFSNLKIVESEIREILDLNSSSLMGGDASSMFVALDVELMEMARCMMATMVSAFMVLFALIIVVVCLLVVRFRIVNSIEEDILKIGSLKSVGYTSRQIISSFLLQYLIISVLGCVIGIALTYLLLPSVSSVFEQQSGLRWEQGFDVLISSITFFTIMLFVVIITLIATRRIKKLSPTIALRGESSGLRYKKNYFPLKNTKGPLVISLAFKSILQNLKHNLMILVILIAVTFAGTFGVLMYYNAAVNTKAFAEVSGQEICDVLIALNNEMDQNYADETISKMDSVRKTQYLDEVKVKVNDMEISTQVMDSYKGRESNYVYEGRYPESNNEITMAGVLAERSDKSIGDTVTLNFGNNQDSFTVVGLSNGSLGMGLNATILTEDFKKLNPDFKQQSLYIYLDEGTNIPAFIEQLTSTLDKEQFYSVINFEKAMEDGMASYQGIVAAVGVVMLIITLMVVALVLYFLISSTIIREKRDLGIQKAIGFTTAQLMNQLSIKFTVPIIIGTIVGSFLGALYTNPLLSVAMKSMGIMKANFIVAPAWVVGFAIATIGFSYLLCLLVTWRIRKISAYELITE